MEKLEQLLQRSRKQRDLGSAVLRGILILSILLAAYMFYVGWRLIYPLWQAVHSGRPLGTPTVPPWFEAISNPGGLAICAGTCVIIYCHVLQFITSLNLADERVKTLLLFRSLRKAPKQESPGNKE